MQETLRTEFSDRTLLAVAHRLHTIIEADRWDPGCVSRLGAAVYCSIDIDA
jgi:hypothetical protein